MKNFYYAITIQENCKNFAYVVKAGESDNLLSVFSIKGVTVVNACSTKKEAVKLADFWNDCYKKNNTYMF